MNSKGLSVNYRNFSLVLRIFHEVLLIVFFVAAVLTNLSCSKKKAASSSSVGIDGQGKAELIPCDSVEILSCQNFLVKYTAGRNGIAKGGGVVVHFPVFWDWTVAQTDYPGRPGYTTFNSLSCSSKPSFEVNYSQNYAHVLFENGSMRDGESFEIVYGGVRVDPYSEASQEFKVKVDGDGDGEYAEISEQPHCRIVAGRGVQLYVTASSILYPGEKGKVSVSVLDRADNLASSFKGEVVLYSGHADNTEIARYSYKRDDRGTHFFEIMFPKQGMHRIYAKIPAESIEDSSNVISVQNNKKDLHLFWGDIHGHSSISDGTGSPEDYFFYARNVSNLDVAALTDHDSHGMHVLTDSIWEHVQKTANSFNKNSEFVTFIGYEWTNWIYGHRNVYYLDSLGTVYDSKDRDTDTPEELWSKLIKGRAVTIPHHPGGAPVPTDWNHYNPDFDRVVEICSVHGISDYFGCARGIRGQKQGASVVDALSRGYRLGIIGSSDGHIGHPGRRQRPFCTGIVGIWARELSRDAIWEALWQRRVYGTTGERIILEMDVDGFPMGSVISKSGKTTSVKFNVAVVAESRLASIEIVKNNHVVYTEPGKGMSGSFKFDDSNLIKSGDFYFVRVTQADGGMAWSSPVWFE